MTFILNNNNNNNLHNSRLVDEETLSTRDINTHRC